jgi:hypothetical protein
MSKNSTGQDAVILEEKIEEMEKSLIKLEKLIDNSKKQGEKNAVKTLEVFHSSTLQEIERTKKKLENIRKNDN